MLYPSLEIATIIDTPFIRAQVTALHMGQRKGFIDLHICLHGHTEADKIYTWEVREKGAALEEAVQEIKAYVILLRRRFGLSSAPKRNRGKHRRSKKRIKHAKRQDAIRSAYA